MRNSGSGRVSPRKALFPQLPVEPGTSDTPVSLHCGGSYPESLCCFFDGQAAKVTQLVNAALLGIAFGQLAQALVNFHHVRLRIPRRCLDFRYRDLLALRTALRRLAAASMIHENAAHLLGRDRHEVCATLPARVLLIGKAEVSFVDEGSRGQRVIRALAPDVALSQAAQLAVDEGNQFAERLLVALFPRDKKPRHFFGGGHRLFPEWLTERIIRSLLAVKKCALRPLRL